MNGLLTRRQCAKRLQGSSQQVTLSGGNSSALQMLPTIPLIDARSDPLTAADPAAVRALRDTIFGSFRPISVPALPLVDWIARRWLVRSTSPYLADLTPSRRIPAQRGPTPSISLTSMVARPWLLPMRQ